MFAWKRVSDGDIVQGIEHTAPTADDLFEKAGFGAVEVDKPIKGYLAVEVEMENGALVEKRRDLDARTNSLSM